MAGPEFSGGNDGSQGVLCPLPTRSLYDHPLRSGFYDQTHLENLVESIKTNGLLEPVLVRPCEGAERERYEVLSGHYRVRAVRQLRRPMIMGRVMVCDDRTAKMIFCTARLLTKGLSAIEEALILREMVTGESLGMSAAGSLFGHGKSWVSRRLKLLASLEPGLRDEVGHGLIAPRVAEELCRLFPRGNDQARVLAIVRKHHLNKEEVRELVTRWLQADEAERARLEESFRRDGPAAKPKPGTARGARAHARQQLRSGKEILDGLLQLVTDTPSPVVDWWPVSAWRRLDGSFRTLAAELGPLVENSEGGVLVGMETTD